MPSTYNGIGTHYYGKKNHTARNAVCKSCQRMGNLESYDTRLFFVIVFIPVIPLGRKRIIDKCPSCSRHYAMALETYEQTKQLQTSAGLEQFRREPSVPAAITAHAQLLGFHEHEQAAELRKTALERYRDHAGLRAAMAEQLHDMSNFQESSDLFKEALRLDPELPEARMGVARQAIATGNLDQADKLLAFLTEPGAGQIYPLMLLDILAKQYQKADRHRDALRIAAVLLRELPILHNDHTYRSFVKKSEKALNEPETLLTQRRHSVMGLVRSENSPYAPWQRKLVIGTAAALLVIGGLAINNEYIRRHRSLHVLNATGQTAQVQIDDAPPVPVNDLTVLTTTEGPHTVSVTGPVTDKYNISLASDYFARWTHSPAWILNLGGEGVLEEMTHTYSVDRIPSQTRLVVGETFSARPHIDYLFTKAPTEIQLKRNANQQVTKTEIAWFRANDTIAFQQALLANRKTALAFAQARLTHNPNQPDLLEGLLEVTGPSEQAQLEAFLEKGLALRPVNIPWHRAYQTLVQWNNHKAGLVPRYESLLAADPGNAALIYLRGRIEQAPEIADTYFRRSIAADPTLAWPWLALAARASADGDWAACLKAANEAQKRKSHQNPDQVIAWYIHLGMIGTGKAKELAAQYQSQAARPDAGSFQLFALLGDALAAAGRETEIDSQVSQFVMRLPPELAAQAGPQMKTMGLYLSGRVDQCAQHCAADPRLRNSPFHFQSLLALGRTTEAEDNPLFAAVLNDPVNQLALSVSFQQDGNQAAAASHLARALAAENPSAQRRDFADVAKILAAKTPPSIEEIRRLHADISSKCLVIAALVGQFPTRAAEYRAELARFNISRLPPYYLIERIVSPTKKSSVSP